MYTLSAASGNASRLRRERASGPTPTAHGSMMRLRLGARGPSSSAQGVLALSPATTQAVRGFACDGFLALSSAGPQLLRNCLGHSRGERRCGAQCPSVLIAVRLPNCTLLGAAAFTPWPSHRGLHTVAFTPVSYTHLTLPTILRV